MQYTQLPIAHYDRTVVPQLKDKLFEIRAEYGKLIAAMAILFPALSELLITSIIFIESGGKNVPPRSRKGPIGLMQINRATASDCVILARRKGLLTLDQQNKIRELLGEKRANCLQTMKWGGEKLTCNNNTGLCVSEVDLANPEHNLFFGCLYLNLLCAEHINQDGTIRLHEVIARYNRGYYSKVPKTNDVNQFISLVPAETKSYVLKLIGTNGMLDILEAA